MAHEPSISIEINVSYLELQSLPEQSHYLFAYTVTITNTGEETARLLSRYWQITNGDGESDSACGPGVIGKQPYLAPGENFTYTSSTALDTEVGSMQGHYGFQSQSGELFDVDIPSFCLARPGVLH